MGHDSTESRRRVESQDTCRYDRLLCQFYFLTVQLYHQVLIEMKMIETFDEQSAPNIRQFL